MCHCVLCTELVLEAEERGEIGSLRKTLEERVMKISRRLSTCVLVEQMLFNRRKVPWKIKFVECG